MENLGRFALAHAKNQQNEEQKTVSKSRPAEVSGILIVHKHAGCTSHNIISMCRRRYQTTQVGHTGTLDPMATGVLPVLIGRAVKASDYIMAEDKRYIAEMELGYTTDTEDSTGEVLTRFEGTLPTPETVLETCHRFTGKIDQVPPMYSALKVGGRKLVDLAREGIEVERESRAVEIMALTCEPLPAEDGIVRKYRLDVSCSKGTYIRTLCADIGKALGCGAVMSALTRVRTGNYTLDEAYTIDQLNEMTYEERLKLPQPVETLFTDLPEAHVSDFYAKLVRGGTELYQKRIHVDLAPGQLIRLYHRDTFFALGKGDILDGEKVVRPEKLFVL